METNYTLRFPSGSNFPLKCDQDGNLRILVVGNSGAGKSTMAGKLAEILQLPVIYLDQLYWQPNWREATKDELRGQVERFFRQNDSWIIDGNYKKVVGDLTYASATCIIWMDPPFALYFPRMIVRTFMRLIRLAPPCSAGCDEKLADIFTWGKKSILWWCWNNHTPEREFCTAQMQQPGGEKWIRLGGWGREANAWLKQVELFAKRQ